ncbi:chaperone protein DNAJ [Trypanosoma rangeli]|uniref:Chaperone protein DNAJ n=1 Tax=Trypanosoma rangeli TaxID=5698 RepID=A0A422NZZ9_TRYRA|nr:chaperone protein DNAJ [Trypanosoma rangeli]RNF11038.1 chaperone protein DNAJ [Trypanosoma rangeli]|eukprot:RNF11038.1 chaperone protein DNAJ [Trypanosoma rangeli]
MTSHRTGTNPERETRGITSAEGGELNAGALLGGVFASGEPKHALDGLSDAAQNIAVGVGVGLGGLVGIPVAKWRTDGAVGAAKGAAMGVAALLGMTTYGVVQGAVQVAKGVCHTKEAVVEAAKGERYWDSQEGRWVEVHLDSAFAELPAGDDDLFARAHEAFRQTPKTTSSAGDDATAGAAPPSSQDYYVILGVPRTATAAEIRRAFHRMALAMHPDKNPNNAEATLRFQELLEANAVLSDEGRRAHYDKYGAVDDIPNNASSFTQLEEALGATFMEVFVGRLSYALYFMPNMFITEPLKKEFQRRRTLRLAQRLICFVDEEVGLDAALPAIRDAVSTRMGPKLMSIVGQQYIAAARQHLNESSFQRQLDIFVTSKWSALVQMADVAKSALSAVRHTRDEEGWMGVLLALCGGDVRRTVLRAARLILYDNSVPPEKRERRAKALFMLGKMVIEVCRSAQSSE